MQGPDLTPVGYIVLGLLERCGEATPYELKQLVARSIGNFWSIPHSQLYSEPDRLTLAGLVRRKQEDQGLRRKHYTLTPAGAAALQAWRLQPSSKLPELRDESLLKLFFEADPRALAGAQRAAHAAKLEEYEAQAATDPGTGDRGPWRALAAGIAHEREWVRFWTDLGGEPG